MRSVVTVNHVALLRELLKTPRSPLNSKNLNPEDCEGSDFPPQQPNSESGRYFLAIRTCDRFTNREGGFAAIYSRDLIYLPLDSIFGGFRFPPAFTI